ncbi:hypothetical protein OF83DRAFT_1082460 [Amylostereum chailletii]|nr:hypothetical protein OF83DRAFT_1082460 [Amylostereum chailletii]
MPFRAPYHGTKRRLVLAFDLGTTFSGISYAVLDPGQVPVIKTVSRYPGQEAGDSKVQTVIYYDTKGKVVATGAEELLAGDKDDEDEDEDDWQDAQPQKLEWFKLLLRPKQPATTVTKGIPTPRLPPSKDIIDVYADFYAYLFARAREYIQQTHANGDLLWDSVADDVDFTYFLVGGFAASEYLYAKLNAFLNERGSKLFRPDSHTNKAVAEGAVSFHIDHFVRTRVAKLTYGIECRTLFVPGKNSHEVRRSQIVIGMDGTERLMAAFDSILKKVLLLQTKEAV